jgi:predicted naringenin-chalcone synthase
MTEITGIYGVAIVALSGAVGKLWLSYCAQNKVREKEKEKSDELLRETIAEGKATALRNETWIKELTNGTMKATRDTLSSVQQGQENLAKIVVESHAGILHCIERITEKLEAIGK